MHQRAHWTVNTFDMGKARLVTVKTCEKRKTQSLTDRTVVVVFFKQRPDIVEAVDKMSKNGGQTHLSTE